MARSRTVGVSAGSLDLDRGYSQQSRLNHECRPTTI